MGKRGFKNRLEALEEMQPLLEVLLGTPEAKIDELRGSVSEFGGGMRHTRQEHGHWSC